ncbi:unnamed protein product [Rhizophagus irregularis]|uniref:Uncharacterized protein n=1 Tax=Rhizophagus irregularis TaxID=588596 RepID=A0A2N1NNB2_9GLOM|nr:hypothetical protein RhiirC2_846081 [Rhizophagus irregularis]CAB4398510.1 unnamed protein product [Rhizophagus irregularis]CAB5358450.1 unnamed protein product [Rhizophagus irregularis]
MTSTVDAEETLLLNLIFKLQDPIPQYVLGCLPAIATIGAAPDNGLMNKLIWIFRSLGSPFSGLFYFCNINEKGMCAYWLPSDSFIQNGNTILYRPFGHHAMELDLTPNQKKYMRECIAEATVLDRLSSLASAYYIIVGIFAGIARATGAVGNPCIIKDWPYIPLALAWTIPVICVRVFNGRVVFKDPRHKFYFEEPKEEESEESEEERTEKDEIEIMEIKVEENGRNESKRIRVKKLKEDMLNSKIAHTMLTAAFSVLMPWMAVFMAYFTKPIGFACRSKYLTVVCSIWTINSLLAYILHLRGEKSVSGHKYIHGWFCLCGVIITILFTLLGLLSNTQLWWINLFGNSCITDCS